MERPGPSVTREPVIATNRALYNGFGNALGQAVELVVTPLLFLALGAWLDGRFGTRPVLTVVLCSLALCGVAVSSYYRYTARMAREDEGRPWKQ